MWITIWGTTEEELEVVVKEIPKTKVWVKSKNFLVNGEDFISTGILSMDAMMGWWYAMWRIVEVAWWNNVWKTTLVLKGALEAQKLGFHVLFIDAEKAMDEKRLVSLWLDLKKLTLVTDDIIETWFQKIKDDIEKSKKPIFIIFDSVGEAQAHVDTQGDVGESRMMARAKVYSVVLNQIKWCIRDSNSVLVLINQYYNTTATYGDNKTTKGWQMIPYVCSQRLELVWENTKSKQIKIDGEEELAGQDILIRFVKTKVLNPVHKSEIKLSIRYIDWLILEFNWYLRMIKAWDLLKLEWGIYSYLWKEIWSLQKTKNWIVKNKAEIDIDLKARYTDTSYVREIFNKFKDLLPF